MTEKKLTDLWLMSGGDIYVYADLVAREEREACANLADECVNIEKLGDEIRSRGQE